MVTRTRRIRRLLGLLTTVATIASLAIPMVAQPAQANHGTRTLEVYKEKENVPVGTTSMATLTAKLSSAPTAGTGPIDVDFEIESGPGDISSGQTNPPGKSPFQPDLTCSVPVGQRECTVTYGPNATTGRDIIRAWIDHDKSNATYEADDAEGRVSDPTTDCQAPAEFGEPPSESGSCTPQNNSAPSPGTEPLEPDNTDVVERNWVSGPAAILDCEPETSVRPSIDDPNSSGDQSSQTYTCTLTDEFGNAKTNIRVDGENLNGANDPDNSALASTADYDHDPRINDGDFCDGSGSSCSDSVSAIDGESGTANICFWFDSDGDNVFDPAGGPEDGGDCDVETQGQNDNDLTDTVTITWQARSTQGGGVDAEPETDVNNTGETHRVTATVYDQFGIPLVGANQVKFEFFQGSPADTDGNTPASPDRTCTTNNSSTCFIEYTSSTAGRDRICVWTNDAPTMTGDNQNGTCDGGNGPEGLNDADDDPANADAPEPASDDVDVVEKIWQVAGQASRLDCSPETATNPSGTTHTITCTATDASGNRVSGVHVDAEATGANDPDGSDSPTTPDFSCLTVADEPTTPTTNEAGTCSFKHGPSGGVGSTNSTGVTTYRAWIDKDNNNGTVEADTAEGRDEVATPGSKAEPDDTDVVEKSWVAQPASVTISPKADTANVGECNPYTITATNANNQPAQGAIIDVEQIHTSATNNTQNDEPRVLFCIPPASAGPNPSDVDTTKGDLGPGSTSNPKEDPDNPGTAGGETVQQTDAAGKVTIGIKVEPANNSDGSGQVNITAWFESAPDDDDPNSPQDTASKIWEVAEGRTIDCEPETAGKQTGTTHTVTCTVRDRTGNPVKGEGVTFSESGPGSIQGSTTDTTDENGRADVTVTSNEEGTQTVTGTLTDDLQGGEPGHVDECDRAAGDPSGAPAGQCSDDVTVTWQGEPECSDGIDNDGDNRVDFPNDPGCENAQDNDESNDPSCPGYENDSRNQIVGTPGDDQLTGTPGDDIICGLGGDDFIQGEGGDDVLLGGDGNDAIRGGGGNDELRGEGGKDELRGNGGSDIHFGGDQNDVIFGNAGSDLLVGNSGKDVLKGGKDDDTARGGSNTDDVRGGTGNDLLKGGSGKDVLRGGAGNDLLRGGKDDDVLRGGANDDRLNGGGGTDTCVGGPGRDRKFKCEQ